MPDETVWRTMLFDFYGDLLTDKQREYYDLHYNQDLSLAEIAASPRSVQPRPRWRIRSRSCATPSAATPGLWPSRRCGSFRI